MSDMAIRGSTSVQTGGAVSGGYGEGTTGVGQGLGAGGGGLPGVGGGGTSMLASILGSSASSGGTGGPGGAAATGNEKALDGMSSGDALTRLADFLAAIGSDDVLAKLLIEQAGMNRQQALDQRLAARDAAKSELMGQAESTRDAAAAALASAIIQAVVAIVASVVTIAMSVGSAGKAAKAFDAASEGASASRTSNTLAKEADGLTGQAKATKMFESSDAAINAKEFDAKASKLNSDAMTQSQLSGAYGSLINAGGSAVGGALDYAAKMEEAEGQEKAAQAQTEQSTQELAKKLMEEMADLVRSTLDFIKQMQQAETDMMASMTRV